MSKFNCKLLRRTVAIAAALLFVGIALQAPRLLLDGQYPLVTTLLSGTGLLAVVLSPMLMLATALLTLIPRVAKDLELCEH